MAGGRGPLPVSPGAAGAAAPTGGVFFWLQLAYDSLPPIAKLGLARKVKTWAEGAERAAAAQMSGEDSAPGPTHFETTGHSRP